LIKILLRKTKITKIIATNDCGSLNIYVIAMVKIVAIKFRMMAILKILLILTFMEAKLYNPIKMYESPVPKYHNESAFIV